MVKGSEETLSKEYNSLKHKGKTKEANRKLFELAKISYEKEHYAKSKRILNDLLISESELKGVRYYLGLIALEESHKEKARSYFKQESKIDPKNKRVKILYEKVSIATTFPIITILLIFLNCATFFFLNSASDIGLKQLFLYALHSTQIDYAQSITSLFIHANIYHFIINMIALFTVGIIVEKHIGSMYFLLTYFSAGILGNITQAIVYEGHFVLGASSSIFALFGSLLLIMPFTNCRIFGLIKVPIIIFVSFIASISILLEQYILFEYIYFGNIAHLIGLTCGIFLVGIKYQERISTFYAWTLMTLGLWFGIYSLISLIMDSTGILDMLFSSFLVAIAFGFVWYSYSLLYTIEKAKGEIQ